MGLFDRAIAFAEDLAPEWALRRATARKRQELLNSGYDKHGASRTKKALAGWVTSPGGPDSDIVDNLDTLRERSRDLCMGEGLAIGALRTIRSNEIGPGLQLNAKPDTEVLGLTPEEAQTWENQVEREFAMWANTKMCDASRRSTFGEMQALARLSQLMSGDVFALLPAIPRAGERYDLRVQLLEADRVCNPDIRDMKLDLLGGVEVGLQGEPVAYHIADRHPADVFSGGLRMIQRQKWTRVPAFGPLTGRPLVLHLMESERPGQRRGVPILAPVMEKLKQLSRYSEYELMATVVSSMFTAAITSSTPQTPLGAVLPPIGSGKADTQVDTGNPDDYQLGPGVLLGLAPGEKLEAVDPSRPNTAFEAFVLAMCQQIGAGVGVPHEVLLMHFTSSYSASRGALLEFWKRVTVGRTWMAASFCQPVYETWLEEAVARGYIQAPGFMVDPVIRAAWCGAEWHGPTQGQLNPIDEVAAAAQRVREGFSTRTREARELTGGDFWDNHQLRVREEAARRDGGLVDSNAPRPVFTPSAQEAIYTVDEARVASGGEANGDAEGKRSVLEHRLKIEAENAPSIAKAAEAQKGTKEAAA